MKKFENICKAGIVFGAIGLAVCVGIMKKRGVI